MYPTLIKIGQFEITNQQWCDFLNDAQRDATGGAPTRRSSNMYFHSSGNVYLESTISPYEYIC